VSVSDSGIGIRPEDMPSLFEPFRQIPAELPGRNEGTGLGLYLSKRLAEAMEGWVRAASEVGRGSPFTLGLRLAGSAEFVDSGLSPLEANHHG
jgi:signal transduction histidine kinase